MRVQIWLPLGVSLVLAACAGPTFERGASAPDARSPLAAGLPAAIEAWPGPERLALQRFYTEREHRPVWFDDGEHADERASAVAEMRAARVEGVDAAWAEPADVEARLAAEVGLTAALARRLRADPDTDVLVVALADDLRAMQPTPARQPVYGAQEVGIERYRAIVRAGGWPTVPEGPTLDPGSIDPRVDALRDRLLVTGDLVPGTSAGPRYDPALVAALQRFQARHGLAVDGRVGPATLRALNVPATQRLEQLEGAEREKRALARLLGDRYVLVNLPAYELRYVEGGEVRHAADVVIGSVEYQTPIFSHSIDHLVFNPDWMVPRSIANRSLLPQFREDPVKMAAQGYRLLDGSGEAISPIVVDWDEVADGRLPYRVRQLPGPANALGEVKFMFPNEHAVYLHDTPTRSYFARSMRALSNGCVRVQDPMTLAELLLAPEGWDRRRIDDLVRSDRTRTVRLREPVAVHLAYITAWAEADGTVQFRNDVYGRETATMQLAAR